MIRNYLTIAFRSLVRNKLSSIINILGLALALTCCITLYLYIVDEVSYDRYHSKSERIYRLTRSFHSPEGEVSLHLSRVAPPVGPLLKNDIGSAEQVARTLHATLAMGVLDGNTFSLMNNEPNVFFAEPALLKIFDINVVSGNVSSALVRPNTVLISEGMALKYFNSPDVIGKIIRADNQIDLEVTGTFKAFPNQSHLHPEFLVSFSTLEDDAVYGRTNLETNWGNNSFGTYVLLDEGADAAAIERVLPDFMDKHFGGFVRERYGNSEFVASKVTTLYLQKVTDIHLHSHLDDELEPSGSMSGLYILSAIAIFIIVIACFNFINLSTAQATKRSKEVGLRKTVGAFRMQLIVQFLAESVMIALSALCLALAFSSLTIAWINDFTGKQIGISLPHDAGLIMGLAALAVTVGVLAGIYPAFVISSFRPALSLKGRSSNSQTNMVLRKALVVLQFSISIALVIATLVTLKQVDFLQSKTLGYDKEQVVNLPMYADVNDRFESFYHALQNSSLVKHVGRSSRIPTGRLLDSYGGLTILQGDSMVNPNAVLKAITVDEEFFKTYGIQFYAGRNFSGDVVSDSVSFVVNETAARAFGWKEPERYINQEMEYAGTRGRLIGVVKDFHFESLHQPIAPIIFVKRRNNYNTLSLKITGNTTASLQHIEKVWKEFLPGRPFTYQFLSEQYGQLYATEQRQSVLFAVFGGLAIFLASIGLFGLTAFNTAQRIREIGIRKVLGATVPHILQLLSKEIVVMILIANVLAWPVAFYFMQDWLNSFAYHITLNITMFVTAAATALTIAIVTVTSQALKAALANPAKTLKHE